MCTPAAGWHQGASGSLPDWMDLDSLLPQREAWYC